MVNEAIKGMIEGLLPEAKFDESGEFLNISAAPEAWKSFAQKLRHNLHFDYLFCLTCVDWKTHLTMVYHLTQTTDRNNCIVVKVNLDRNKPEVETVCDIWRTAEFHEREVFEMFGVQFLRHPDLRKLILTDDFEGYPLRKDFEDPINMIKL